MVLLWLHISFLIITAQFILYHNAIWGHSTTTWTEFGHFLTPPPLWVDSFYTLSVDQTRHFLTPYPLILPTYLLSYWMVPFRKTKWMCLKVNYICWINGIHRFQLFHDHAWCSKLATFFSRNSLIHYGVVHQIVSPISNSESTNFFNEYLIWFLFQPANWEKTVLDQ